MLRDHKKLGILLIIIGLIIILLILYFAWRKPAAPASPLSIAPATTTSQLPAGASTGSTTPSDIPANHTVYNLAQEPPHLTNANDLSKIAMAFAERFGSFSNQSNYSNISDLQISMTDSMRAWSNTYIQQLTAQYKNNGAYYGITTHALISTVSSFDDKTGRAEIVVTTQRTESDKSAPYNQKLDLRFLQVNGEWLVDNAHWEK